MSRRERRTRLEGETTCVHNGIFRHGFPGNVFNKSKGNKGSKQQQVLCYIFAQKFGWPEQTTYQGGKWESIESKMGFKHAQQFCFIGHHAQCPTCPLWALVFEGQKKRSPSFFDDRGALVLTQRHHLLLKFFFCISAHLWTVSRFNSKGKNVIILYIRIAKS